MSYFFKVYAVIALIIFINNCSDNGTTPNNKPDTTSHNFEWIIDTLKTPEINQLIIEKIIGINTNEVWAAGHCSDSRYSIWFWDGQTWEVKYPGSFFTAPSYYDILIDNTQNIWFAGEGIKYLNNTLSRSDFIIKNVNGTWMKQPELGRKYCKLIVQNENGLISLACDSGYVFYFNETGYEKEWIGLNAQPLDLWVGNSNLYLMTAIEELNNNHILLARKDSVWTIIDKINFATDGVLAWKFGSSLWGPDTTNLYAAGQAGIYKYENNGWHEEVYNKPFQVINGSDLNNIFAGTVFGDLYHYNGSAWKRDEEFSSLYHDPIMSIWTQEDYVFIAVSDGTNSYIARGIRK